MIKPATKQGINDPYKIPDKAKNINKDKQLDLFSWSLEHTTAQKPAKVVLCLDCNLVKLTMVFNPNKGIYIGDRICVNCKSLQKRRFLNDW